MSLAGTIRHPLRKTATQRGHRYPDCSKRHGGCTSLRRVGAAFVMLGVGVIADMVDIATNEKRVTNLAKRSAPTCALRASVFCVKPSAPTGTRPERGLGDRRRKALREPRLRNRTPVSSRRPSQAMTWQRLARLRAEYCLRQITPYGLCLDDQICDVGLGCAVDFLLEFLLLFVGRCSPSRPGKGQCLTFEIGQDDTFAQHLHEVVGRWLSVFSYA